MELKGIITGGDSKPITCCTSVMDLYIGDKSLFDELDNLFNQDAEEYFNDSQKESPQYGVKYVILEKAPEQEITFNDLSAEVQQNMMYADYYAGCYSEYTCGYGGFDYVLGKDGQGHSVFEELKSYVGKYVHFKI